MSRLLDRIEIASPCSADWDGMKGDDRRRHCAQCDLDVFDLSSLTRVEAEAFLRDQLDLGGRTCVRFYRRADGTVLTQDCPVGRGQIGQRRSFLAAGLTGAAALMVGGAAGLLASARGRRLPQVGGGSTGSTGTTGPVAQGRMVMGDMAVREEPREPEDPAEPEVVEEPPCEQVMGAMVVREDPEVTRAPDPNDVHTPGR